MKFLAHLLPRVEKLYVDEETTVDLSGDKYNHVANSLIEFVNLTQPNVLMEHELDGGTRGRVVEAYSDEDGICAKIIIEEDSLPDKFIPRFVSPRIAWNHKDVTGTIWPAALLELSLVSIPRFLVGQKELLETKFSESYHALNTSVELVPLVEEAMTKEEVTALIEEVLTSRESAMAASPKTEMGYTDKMADPSVEIEVSPAVEEESPMGEMIEDISEITDVDAYVSGLAPEAAKEHLARLIRGVKVSAEESLMSEIKMELSARGISSDKAKDFFTLASADKKAFTSAMSAIPRVAKRETPVAAKPLNRSVSSSENPVEAALEAVRRGEGKFSELLPKFTKS
jgi:hypothetical protein